MENTLEHPLSFVNMGSGIGTPYSESDRDIDLVSLGSSFVSLSEGYRRTHPDTEIITRSGAVPSTHAASM